MNTKPYTVEINCPFSNRKEEVHFYETKLNGQAYLYFAGCDHEFHKCDKCTKCRKEAYNQIVSMAE